MPSSGLSRAQLAELGKCGGVPSLWHSISGVHLANQGSPVSHPTCFPGGKGLWLTCQVAGVLVLGRTTRNSILHSQKPLGVWCWFFKEVPPSPEGHRQLFFKLPPCLNPCYPQVQPRHNLQWERCLVSLTPPCSAVLLRDFCLPLPSSGFIFHMLSWSKPTPSTPLEVSPKEKGCHYRRREQAVGQEPWCPKGGLAGVSESEAKDLLVWCQSTASQSCSWNIG